MFYIRSTRPPAAPRVQTPVNIFERACNQTPPGLTGLICFCAIKKKILNLPLSKWVKNANLNGLEILGVIFIAGQRGYKATAAGTVICCRVQHLVENQRQEASLAVRGV